VLVCQLRGPSTGGIRRHVEALSTALGVVGVATDGVTVSGVRDLRPGLVRRLNRADVVHAHGLRVGLLAVVLVRRPVVVTVHNISFDGQSALRRRVTRLLERFVGQRADAVIATSSAIVTELESLGVAPAKISLFKPFGPVPSPRTDPVAVRASLGLSPDDRVIVAVARLHQQKGLDVLVAAFALVIAIEPAARLLVIGPGPLQAELDDQVGRLGLRGRVIMRDDADDVAGVIAMADVFAITSRWESGPIVALEAAELGRAIVATPVGFVPEIFKADHSYAPIAIDDVRGTADAILDLLASPERAESLGSAAKAAVGSWLDRGALVNAHVLVYTRAVERD